MILLPLLDVKNVSNAEPGELIVFALRSHRALAIVLAKETARSLIGILETNEENLSPAPPFAFHLDRQSSSAECLSYGTNWVLELLPTADSVPGRRRDWETPGSIYISADGARIFFRDLANRSFGGGYSFNLTSNELTSDTDAGTPHLSWQIWANEADRDHPSRSPIFSFEQSSSVD